MPRAKKEVEIVYVKEPQQKTNGMAVASFVLSLCGIVTLGVTTILGFVLGIIAVYQIKERDEKGMGLATTAIVLGSILIAVFIIGLLIDARL